jgi:anthranilate/para-aminobenzoate synthase component II
MLAVRKDGELSPYMHYVSRLVNRAMMINDMGRNFPIWGTCLGFESMLLALSDMEVKITNGLSDINWLHRVKFDTSKSSVFSKVFDENGLNELGAEELLYFNHDYGYLYDQTINHPYVRENIDILANMTTSNGVDVVAAFQHKRYPFTGIQYHPEKNQFIYSDGAPKTTSNKLNDVGRNHALVAAGLFTEARSPIDFKTYQQLKAGMRQIFDDGNQSETFNFDPYEITAEFF